MWFILSFKKKKAAAALIALISLEPKSLPETVKAGLLTSYEQVFNHLLETCATGDIIAEAYAEIVRITQATNMSPLQYAEALWMSTLWCAQVYDDYFLEETFVGGLPSSTRHSMRSY